MLHIGYSLCFCCRLLIFVKINFFEKVFQEYHQRGVSHSLDPDQVRHLQVLSADDKSRGQQAKC